MNNTDQWNSLSDFLSNMIVKYAEVLDIESLPSPTDDTDNIILSASLKATEKDNLSKAIEINKNK